MRRVLLLLALIAVALLGVRQLRASGDPPPRRPLFAAEIAPLLSARCQPCHYPGGKVYAAHPFDDSAAVATLGKRLLTRLKDSTSRDLILRWVAPARR